MSTGLPSFQADHAEWHSYARLLSASHQAYLPEIKSLVRSLPLARARRVLDVPCGDGFYTELLADHLELGSEVVGLDVDSDALKAAAQRTKHRRGKAGIRIFPADIFAMPFDDEEFDFAWCAQSLISLSEPAETPVRSAISDALREIHRVLRPGGQIGLLEQDAMHNLLLPWPADLELALHRAERLGFARMYGHPQQLDMGRQLRKLLTLAGFHPLRRMTLSADRQGIPNRDLHTFLRMYFRELRCRVESDLTREELRKFERLTDPASGDSFFHDPDYEMTWLEFVSLGIKA